MASVPPTPEPARPGGALRPSRAQLAVGVIWLALLGASIGASFALWGAVREIRAQGFAEHQFARSIHALLTRAADRGVLQGGLTALWFLGGALLAFAIPRVRALLEPRELLGMLESRERLLRAQSAVALAFLLAILALDGAGPGLSRAQVVLLGALALTGVLALAGIARFLRASATPRDVHAEAAACGATCAAAVFVALGFVAAGERIWRPFAAESLAADALLLLGAAGAFCLVRRRIRESSTSPGAARGKTPGGLALRAFLALLVLPALAPLVVRALPVAAADPELTPRARLDVVVIGIDTLRADAVDLAEPKPGERDRTPHLRALARRGVRFTQAISQAPWTMPAFASVLTGKYPLEHGAVSLTGRLRDREFTLAEILREAGWRTGSFVSNDYTDRKHGFQQGYEVFSDDCVRTAEETSSKDLTDLAIEFVECGDGRPSFLFVHYMDPHYQYLDHEGWTWADAYAGWWKAQNDFDNLVRNRHLVGPADLRWLRDRYDEEIAYTDREIGRLLEALERSGALDRALIVVVGDHGEEFLEHGNLGHTTTLYEELVHVPLVVVSPGAQETVSQRDEVVETRRVFSTVLDALGLDFARDARPVGLFAEPAGAREAQRAFSMVWLPDARPQWGKRFRIASLRTPRWKLIRNLTRDTWELFDLAADPAETSELSARRPEVLGELRPQLEAWIEAQSVHAGDVPRGQVGGERLERLRSLGYL